MQIFKGILLTGGVGNDSNIYIVDNQVVIDTGTGEYFSTLKENLENSGANPRDIHTVINTHCHFDHTGGDRKFRDMCKAKLMIHKDDKKALETGKGTMAEYFNDTAKITTIDKVLKEGDVIKTKNFTLQVISTPGHTPGSICLYEPNKKILFSGDTVFSDGVGRTDLPGGDHKALKESLQKLCDMKIDYLFPGHGIPKMSGVEFHLKQMLARTK
jgi:glyoxylase-like metal-dependent hydrolase (beta-lactamase superfamily II)